ncbi:MAG TPA: methylated-DNA--[protein]-cysteine S-methyltransferase [Candidatus Baltobacteraceae bacterium]
MRCCDVEALWDEMRDGVEPRREHVLAHLLLCTHCQELYRKNEGVAYCLSCLPVVEPPPSLVPKILEHIKTVRIPRGSNARPDGLTTVNSPLGKLHITFSESGITSIAIDRGEPLPEIVARVQRRLRRPIREAEPPAWVRTLIEAYFKSWTVDFRHVDISTLTDFEQAALRQAARIPPGEVRSYGWVAEGIGQPQAARAVGQAMARNPIPLLYPCHRVVDASGDLHNYGYGIEMKERILRMEGYRIVQRTLKF